METSDYISVFLDGTEKKEVSIELIKINGNFSCSLCTYKSKVRRHMIDHIESIHLHLVQFECNLCDWKYHNSGNMRKHMIRAHKTDNNNYSKLNTMLLYKKEETNVFKSSTELSPLVYTSSFFEGNEKRKVDIQTVKVKGLYNCNNCQFKTKLKTKFIQHFETNHLSLAQFKCNICSKCTYRKAHIQKHLKKLHKVLNDDFTLTEQFVRSNKINIVYLDEDKEPELDSKPQTITRKV